MNMYPCKKSCLFLFVFLLSFFLPAVGQSQISAAGQESSSGKVDIEVVPRQDTITAGSEIAYAVLMDIEEKWHLNAHNPTLDYLIGVDLEMRSSEKALVADVQYPQPKRLPFSFAEDELDVYEGEATILVKMKTSSKLEDGTHRLEGMLTVQACTDQVCLPPDDVELAFPVTIGDKNVASDRAELFQELENRERATISEAEGNEIASMFKEQGYFWAFLGIFLIGLALNLTPCVYPMLSVTVALFGGQDEKSAASMTRTFSKALVYVLGIVFMYSALGVAAAYTGELFGSWLQSPWVLGGIGVLILLLALSMFGMYELQPPAWVMEKLGNTQQTTGYVGHFLSGLLVGIFAAPCIGPPIIALLAFVGSQGSPFFGFFSFFIMAVGLGFPYLILGTFSGLLNKMPKSGLWMVWVKKVFGVVLVGVGLFYLALAFVPGYTMYAVLATVVAGGLYLGFIEQSGSEKTVFRRIKYAVGVAALVVGVLLYQNLQKESITWQQYNADRIADTDQPVMLYFFADWCIPCIELDRRTFTDNRVIEQTEAFVRMKVDLTHFDSERAERLREKYDIAGVPTIKFLDSEGGEVEDARVVGYLSAEEFLKRLEIAREAYNE